MSSRFYDFDFRRVRVQAHDTNMSWWVFYSPVARFRRWLDHREFNRINEERLEKYRQAEQVTLGKFAGMVSCKIWPVYLKMGKDENGNRPATIVFSQDLFSLAIISAERYRTGVYTRDEFNPDLVLKYRMLSMDIACDSNLPEGTWKIRECA